MGQIIPRSVLPILERTVRESRVTAILGARQVGKSTLARLLSKPYFSLDDLGTRTFALRDPVAFVRELPHGAIIDEVQRAPDLLLAVKSVVDLSQEPGRFILTGSANLLTLPKLADSLTGRMRIIEVHPLAQSEIEQRPSNIVDRFFDEKWGIPTTVEPTDDLITRITHGGYPGILPLASDASRNAWFEDYLLTMLQREIRELTRIGDITEMERLLRLVAVRTGRVLNLSALASDIGMPKETLRRYLGILEQLYLVHTLPAWSSDAGRTYIKAPKVFINDTGLAAYQLGADAERLATNRDLLGNLVETFVVNEIRKHISWSILRPKLFHLRTNAGKEIDLLLEARDGRIVAIEIKAGASPRTQDANTLSAFMKTMGSRVVRGLLMYTGSQAIPIEERLCALPISSLWSE